ncbi:hypothetical protein HK102_001582 [Quaeritorhiza haematococci]|nr:hypothetical protein HK102_001582 [Quaeritorhiza haematococci]
MRPFKVTVRTGLPVLAALVSLNEIINVLGVKPEYSTTYSEIIEAELPETKFPLTVGDESGSKLEVFYVPKASEVAVALESHSLPDVLTKMMGPAATLPSTEGDGFELASAEMSKVDEAVKELQRLAAGGDPRAGSGDFGLAGEGEAQPLGELVPDPASCTPCYGQAAGLVAGAASCIASIAAAIPTAGIAIVAAVGTCTATVAGVAAFAMDEGCRPCNVQALKGTVCPPLMGLFDMDPTTKTKPDSATPNVKTDTTASDPFVGNLARTNTQTMVCSVGKMVIFTERDGEY